MNRKVNKLSFLLENLGMKKIDKNIRFMENFSV